MKKWVTLALTFVLVTALVLLAFLPSEARKSEQVGPAAGTTLYLPLVIKDPVCDLYVINDTRGELCYEVKDTGIGRKCFPSGTHFYGSFLVGTYSWEVSKSPCGTGKGSGYYGEGDQDHRFWCG